MLTSDRTGAIAIQTNAIQLIYSQIPHTIYLSNKIKFVSFSDPFSDQNPCKLLFFILPEVTVSLVV